MIIAIDGTLASGKGTIARRLAVHYGLPHLDTGLLYRATGLAALKRGVSLDDEAALAALASGLDWARLDDPHLRSGEVGAAASQIAIFPKVRAALLQAQRDFAHQPGGAVLDGRDIGTVVCPAADIKLWIDAAIDVRAGRRWRELRDQGNPLSLEDMLDQLRERDARDRSRSEAPMQRAADARLIDTTDLTIDAAVDKAVEVVESLNRPTP
ncbi:MAG: (d)CMP kinase [Henriciella sp.]|jgi:cytidylate kinase